MLEYATLKEADLLMRRAKEEERFAARQAQRQKMIDEGVRQLADLNASTNNRLEAQAIEVANKAAEARHARDALTLALALTLTLTLPPALALTLTPAPAA